MGLSTRFSRSVYLIRREAPRDTGPPLHPSQAGAERGLSRPGPSDPKPRLASLHF